MSIRRFLMTTCVLALLLAPCHALHADTLSGSTTANNGSGGVFFDLTPNSDLTIDSFNLFLSGADGTTGDIELYTRAGSYVGFDASDAGWGLVEVLSATSAGGDVLTDDLSLTVPVSLTAGDTMAFYLHGGTGVQLRYFGTGTSAPPTTWSNADLTMFSDRSRTASVAFEGGTFSPRTYAGDINYTLTAVPEPGSLVLLGVMTTLGTCVRRRKR